MIASSVTFTAESAVSRRSTAPLEAVVLPDLPPPRRNRWGVVLVGAAFLGCLTVIVGIIWGIGTLATTARRAATDSTSLVEHWEEPAERLANLKRAMSSRDVGASAAELRDIHRLLARVANACQSSDDDAFIACTDLNLLVRRISRHPLVRDDRSFSPSTVKRELEEGLTTPVERMGEVSIVRVERGERDDLALVYAVDWDYGSATASRWWLVRHGRNWRLFDWERLDFEQSLAERWANRDAIYDDPQRYNYTVLREAIDATPDAQGGRSSGQSRPTAVDLASFIDDPLPEAIHDASMFDLAWTLIGQGRPTDAIKAANALHRPQDHPGYLIIRARAHSDLNRYREALADAQEYERIAGPDPLALEQAANALAQLGRHMEAAACWRDMMRLAPNHGQALHSYCRLAEPHQRTDLAAILAATRQPIEAAARAAQFAIYEDDPELLNELVDFTARTAPGSPAAIAIAAQRLAFEGRHEQAAAEFKRASEAEYRPDKRMQYFNEHLDAMKEGGKLAQGYAAAADAQAAFDYLTAGWEDDEGDLSDAQLQELLSAHHRRVPGDARADYLAGQLLMRAGDFAGADAKFQAAIDKAADEDKEYYRSGRIEALVRLERGLEAYQTFGMTPEVFRSVASDLQLDQRWDELLKLIAKHKLTHPDDRWADYYEALVRREQGAPALALAALAQAQQGDEQIKSACRWLKRPLLIQAGRLQELIDSTERRASFLELARELAGREDWKRLDELYLSQGSSLANDAEAVDVRTEALFGQGRYVEAAAAITARDPGQQPGDPATEQQLAERHVRCLLRQKKLDEARQVAQRAASELGWHKPQVMVALASGNLAAAGELLQNPTTRQAVLENDIDQDPELASLLHHPELHDLRDQLTVPLTITGAEIDEYLVLLFREPPPSSEQGWSARLARIGIEGARIRPIAGPEDGQRQSWLVEHEQKSLLVTIGVGPYWEAGPRQRLPRAGELAKALKEHHGYVVLEVGRGELDASQPEELALMRQLAAELCSEAGALAVAGWHPQETNWRLVMIDEVLADELHRGAFLKDRPRAGEAFAMSDRQRYPLEEAGESSHSEQAMRRRAAIKLARSVQRGTGEVVQVRAMMWRGHAREAPWFRVVGARRDANGSYVLIGEMLTDSVLRPAVRKGTRVVIVPHEVLEIRGDLSGDEKSELGEHDALPRLETLPRGERHLEGAVGVVDVAGLTHQARDGAVELHEQSLTHRAFAIERFHVPTCDVEPDERSGQVDEGYAMLAANLQGRGRAKGDRLGPGRRHVPPATDLSDRAGAELSRHRKIEAHHLIVVAIGCVRAGVLDADDRGWLKAGDVATPIDLFDHLAEHRRAVARGPAR